MDTLPSMLNNYFDRKYQFSVAGTRLSYPKNRTNTSSITQRTVRSQESPYFPHLAVALLLNTMDRYLWSDCIVSFGNLFGTCSVVEDLTNFARLPLQYYFSCRSWEHISMET